MARAYTASAWDAVVWVLRIPGQLGLHSETFFQNKTNKHTLQKKKKKRSIRRKLMKPFMARADNLSPVRTHFRLM